MKRAPAKYAKMCSHRRKRQRQKPKLFPYYLRSGGSLPYFPVDKTHFFDDFWASKRRVRLIYRYKPSKPLKK